MKRASNWFRFRVPKRAPVIQDAARRMAIAGTAVMVSLHFGIVGRFVGGKR